MRLGRIASLWAIAVALGLLYRAEERRGEPAPTVLDEPDRARLVDVDAADVRAVGLVDGPVVMRLAPEAAGWRVVEPAGTLVPGDLVEAFVESLLAAVVLDAVPPDGDRGSDFGLDEGRRIEIEVGDGSRRVFVLGNETPTGTSAYVRDGTGAVRVIGRNSLVYRELLLDAVRPPRDVEPPTAPVARRRLTGTGRPG